MIPIFRLMCFSCGFDQASAATFLNVREDKARAWWYGHADAPEGVMRDLMYHFTEINKQAIVAVGLHNTGQTLKITDPAVLRRMLEMLPPRKAALIEINKIRW